MAAYWAPLPFGIAIHLPQGRAPPPIRSRCSTRAVISTTDATSAREGDNHGKNQREPARLLHVDVRHRGTRRPQGRAAGEDARHHRGRGRRSPPRCPRTFRRRSRASPASRSRTPSTPPTREDALKYFPSLLVRKRYIGDYDHAVLSSRASGTGNSARSLGVRRRHPAVEPARQRRRLHAALGPGHARRRSSASTCCTARSPRRIPGNSVGAVVDYVTRMPDRFEAHAKAERLHAALPALRHRRALHRATRRAPRVGNGGGRFAWWLDVEPARQRRPAAHLRHQGRRHRHGGNRRHPGDRRRRGAQSAQPGRSGSSAPARRRRPCRTTRRSKLAYDFTPDAARQLHLRPAGATTPCAAAQTYLRDAAGSAGVQRHRQHRAAAAITVAPTDFRRAAPTWSTTSTASRSRATRGAPGTGSSAASVYDYHRDLVRSPTVALPAAADRRRGPHHRPGRHRLEHLRVEGHLAAAGRAAARTWSTSACSTTATGCARWCRTRPTGSPAAAASRFSAFDGDTELTSVYAQDTWRFARDWRATLGVRVERWRAQNGSLASRDHGRSPSPSAARRISRRRRRSPTSWRPSGWPRRRSAARCAIPTVAELYQGSIAADAIVNNDPNLKPEKSWTSELSRGARPRQRACCARRCSSRTRAMRSIRRPTSRCRPT